MQMPELADSNEAHAASLDVHVAVLRAHKRLLNSGGDLATDVHAPPPSVESRVRQLIRQATSEDVLASQPPAWRAWM